MSIRSPWQVRHKLICAMTSWYLMVHRCKEQYFIIDGIKKAQTRPPFQSHFFTESKGPAAELRVPGLQFEFKYRRSRQESGLGRTSAVGVGDVGGRVDAGQLANATDQQLTVMKIARLGLHTPSTQQHQSASSYSAALSVKHVREPLGLFGSPVLLRGIPYRIVSVIQH